MTRMPSATSAVTSHIFGPRAPTWTIGLPYGFGPGLKFGVMRVWVVYSPS